MSARAPLATAPSGATARHAARSDRRCLIACRYPYVTGTSVLGITYADGVLLASDTLGSYGSTKRYKSFSRVRKVNNTCALAAGGELSDFQYIMR